MQRFRDVLSRWEGGELSVLDAGELLAISERQFRRYRDRHEEEELEGLRDRRLGKPSPNGNPAREARKHFRRALQILNIGAYRSSLNPPFANCARGDAMTALHDRAETFSARFGLRLPILLAPMAGACPPSLAIAVANAGGLGACGALLMRGVAILDWAKEVRAGTNGAFQLNLWVPDPAPRRNAVHERRLREFLAGWGPQVAVDAGSATPPDFTEQCEALLEAAPPIVSSVMGLYPPQFVAKLKARKIAWFANVSTVTEALAAEAAGADVIVAQGMEAGGHRGCFDAAEAERRLVGLFALLPTVVDSVRVPVVATGGIADGRGVAAALALGASAAQIGTGFLRCPEAKTHKAWADALASTRPEDTLVSRVFSGRAGRSIATNYVIAASGPKAPRPAPYPVQRGLTAAMREAGQKANDLHRMQAWAGQSACLARAEPAGDVVRRIWDEARAILG
jgi:nitronate monooxygenase